MTAPTAPPAADHGSALTEFLAHRPRLLSIASRVTKDSVGAHDVVQEAWLRWQRTDRARVANPAAFLTSTTTNLAINAIRSAAHRRETPSPLPLDDAGHAGPDQDPVRSAERSAAVEHAMAFLLTRLTSHELAAYVLRQAFDYEYLDLARLIGTSPANARQLVHRARTRLAADGARPLSVDTHRRLVAAFLCAARTGDLAPLETALVGRRPHAAASAGSPSPARRPVAA
jgi:RNA polymerase sigma factor (sigma-70 family)